MKYGENKFQNSDFNLRIPKEPNEFFSLGLFFWSFFSVTFLCLKKDKLMPQNVMQ